jgi:hypothetical protein
MIVSDVVRIAVGNVRCCHLPDYLALVPRGLKARRPNPPETPERKVHDQQ